MSDAHDPKHIARWRQNAPIKKLDEEDLVAMLDWVRRGPDGKFPANRLTEHIMAIEHELGKALERETALKAKVEALETVILLGPPAVGINLSVLPTAPASSTPPFDPSTLDEDRLCVLASRAARMACHTVGTPITQESNDLWCIAYDLADLVLPKREGETPAYRRERMGKEIKCGELSLVPLTSEEHSWATKTINRMIEDRQRRRAAVSFPFVVTKE